jgi:hypothetical protein
MRDGGQVLLLPVPVLCPLLKDDALHEQEQPLIDPRRADLSQLTERENLPHGSVALNLDVVARGVQNLGREVAVNHVDNVHRPSVDVRLKIELIQLNSGYDCQIQTLCGFRNKVEQKVPRFGTPD